MDAVITTIRARKSAAAAASRAGVVLRPLDSTADSFACERFLGAVWRTGPSRPPIAADVIKAIADAGSHVSGAFDERTDTLLGVCIGLWGPPDRPGMHSHLAGVLDSARGRQIGLAVKLDQRAHALEAGVSRITWTFDPLVARNAYFNLGKLGGTATEYLPDYYGRLSDGLNGTDDTDRLMLQWDLLDDRVIAVCDEGIPDDHHSPAPYALSAVEGRPVSHSVKVKKVMVAVPSDIETVRLNDPVLAGQWRAAVREVLGGLLADGARVLGFVRSAEAYLVESGESR
ncbi:hypothetical protein [Amycolatopsis panacis]|uniref:GNAT family N-acetyltransferase n=1 Tax=Amycolatopsis panacis TaxID=2340917 RepID=A0A419HXP3_9PSEU|nr:hypothetical protein [Amycolatopsis panacis]RJQ81881.1 hypothetical protein D5S19_22850 [Amycolatopsis panacis]